MSRPRTLPVRILACQPAYACDNNICRWTVLSFRELHAGRSQARCVGEWSLELPMQRRRHWCSEEGRQFTLVP